MGRSPFQAPRWATCLIVPLLAAIMAAWVRFAPPTHTIDASRLRMDLPVKLGPFSGQVLLYCHNEQCLQFFPVPEGETLEKCPACGGFLMPMSLGERTLLPPDTQIARRIYHGPGLQSYAVTIVLVGSDPLSIHKPQLCLPCQGFSIDRQRVCTLRLAPDRSLSVVVIDIRKGSNSYNRFGFAYWFVGSDCETPYNYVRVFQITKNRLFRSIVSRWAYVSIMVNESLDTPESLDRLTSFIRLLRPAIDPDSKPAS